MRNLIIAVAVIALGAVGYFAFAGNRTAPAVAATPAAVVSAADTAATQTEAVATATQETEETPAETVEESSGAAEIAPDEERLVLAQAEPVKVASKFKPGVHYRELVPAQPTVTNGDKIEVVEVFWYGCAHCYQFDPYVKRWDENKAADVEFVRLPAVWNNTLKKHAAAFYVAEILANNGTLKDPDAFHDAFFDEIHVKQQMLTTDRALEAFFARFGVSADDYASASKSFELDQKLRTATDLTKRYKITGVPAVVVNGRYANISNGLSSYDEYLELIDALVEMER